MITSSENQGVTYTQKLSRGGALIAETKVLLRAWKPGETFTSFVERVRSEDMLGRATARRVQDLVRIFISRFLIPDDAPARHLYHFSYRESNRQTFVDLVFYYTALHDDLLRDFVKLYYWPLVREGRLTISNQEVYRLIVEAEHDGRIRVPWSQVIKRDMANRVLIVMVDFGLLRSFKTGVREVEFYRPADSSILYIAHKLHFDDVTDASLAEHQDWALFGLDSQDVWNRLEALAGNGWFIVQRAGQVVRITWKYKSMEDIVHALAE